MKYFFLFFVLTIIIVEADENCPQYSGAPIPYGKHTDVGDQYINDGYSCIAGIWSINAAKYVLGAIVKTKNIYDNAVWFCKTGIGKKVPAKVENLWQNTINQLKVDFD